MDKTTSTQTQMPITLQVSINAPAQVGDIMTKDVRTMLPDQSFAEVVGMMATRSFHHMLVVDEDERLHGVISDRDVLRALSRTPDWSKKSVAEIMNPDSITTTPEMRDFRRGALDARKARQLLTGDRSRRPGSRDSDLHRSAQSLRKASGEGRAACLVSRGAVFDRIADPIRSVKKSSPNGLSLTIAQLFGVYAS